MHKKINIIIMLINIKKKIKNLKMKCKSLAENVCPD